MTRAAVPVLSLSLLLLVGAAGCKKTEAPPEKAPAVSLPPVPVTVAPIEVRKMPKYLTLTGNVVAERQSEVAANVAGRIVSAPVERGQSVKEGQVLATVDSKAAGFSAAASAAQSNLAETQALQAQADCARAERLFSEGAMARAEYDRQKTQCKAQELQANAARAQAGLSARLAADTVIRAPFTGTLGERYVNVGEYVQASTKVASVYVFDPVRITISVPEPAVGLVHQDQTLDVHVAAWPERPFPATVVYLSPALRSATRDLLVEARASNPDGALRPGMFATVDLAVGEEPLPTVPEDALVVDSTVKRLFLAKEGRAFELVVRTGVKKDGRVAIIEALDPNTRVIVHPPPGLHDGSPIAEGGATAEKRQL